MDMASSRELRNRVVDTLDAPLEPLRVELVIEMLRWALTEVPDLGLPHVGRTVRSAVQMLLADAVPELAVESRDRLARACEVIAVREG